MNSTKKQLVGGAFLVAVSLCLSAQLIAGAAIKTSGEGDPTVRFAGEPLFEITANAGPYEPWARASLVQENLNHALSSAVHLGAAEISVTVGATIDRQPEIDVAGQRIIVITADTAKSSGMTAEQLAQNWAGKIMDAVKDRSAVGAYVAKLDSCEAKQPEKAEGYTHVAPAAKSDSVKLPALSVGSYTDRRVGEVGGTVEMMDQNAQQSHYPVASSHSGSL